MKRRHTTFDPTDNNIMMYYTFLHSCYVWKLTFWITKSLTYVNYKMS